MEKYKTLPKRLLAAIIDGIILYPISFLDSFYTNKSVPLFVMGTLAVAVIYLFYFVFSHAKFGYTIGKKVTGLKVLDVSESRLITVKSSMLRESPLVVINLGVILYAGAFLNTNILEFEEIFYNITSGANLIWVIAELIYALSNKKNRAIHDLIAGSVVVKEPA